MAGCRILSGFSLHRIWHVREVYQPNSESFRSPVRVSDPTRNDAWRGSYPCVLKFRFQLPKTVLSRLQRRFEAAVAVFRRCREAHNAAVPGASINGGFVRDFRVQAPCSESTVSVQLRMTPMNDWIGDMRCIATEHLPQLRMDAASARSENRRSAKSAKRT